VKRRDFIALTGGAAVAWPLAARAQQADRVRRVGALMGGFTADNQMAQDRLTAFRQTLQQLGWTEGRNLRTEVRWSGADNERRRRDAAELVALAPDVILASGTTTVAALLQVSRTVPIVFTVVADPVAAGLVESLARPGGNATGFSPFEYGLSPKWLELLKEIAPPVTRAAVIRDASSPSEIGQFAAMQGVAPALGVDLRPVDVREAVEIERAVAAFARSESGGMIVTSAGSAVHRDLIIALAARHQLPAVYPLRFYVAAGGLIAYGPDLSDQFRRAAGYVDRILRGEKPADLPVQAPTKYELAINLKTARALGLEVPSTLLARADEVIE